MEAVVFFVTIAFALVVFYVIGERHDRGAVDRDVAQEALRLLLQFRTRIEKRTGDGTLTEAWRDFRADDVVTTLNEALYGSSDKQ